MKPLQAIFPICYDSCYGIEIHIDIQQEVTSWSLDSFCEVILALLEPFIGLAGGSYVEGLACASGSPASRYERCKCSLCGVCVCV